jgi:hypothetical protein
MTTRSKELLKSFLLGPVRSLGPAGLNVLLYPILLAHGGLSTIGIWAGLNLVVNIFQMGDLGVAQYVGRSIARGDVEPRELHASAEMMFTAWMTLALGLSVVAFIWSKPFFHALGIEPTTFAGIAPVLIMLAGGLALVCGVLGFMLIGAHLVSVAQMNDVTVSVVQFVVAVALLQFLDPLPALASAFFVRYAARAAGLYIQLRRHGVLQRPLRPAVPKPGQMAGLFKRSGGFAAFRVSQQLIQIVNRSAVLAIGGSVMLGAFEAASRVPFLLEQAVSNGLQSFFSIFSAADWTTQEGRDRARALIRWANSLLAVSSIGALGAWIALSGPMLGLWLNIANPHMVMATQLLATYNLVRAMNGLAFRSLLARGGEAQLGTLYGLQALATGGALLVARQSGGVSLVEVATIVMGVGCITEAALLAVAQWRNRFIAVALRHAQDFVPFVCAGLLLFAGWAIETQPVLRAHAFVPALREGAIYCGIWLAVVLLLSRARPLDLLKVPAY